jgi:hypothetical protein
MESFPRPIHMRWLRLILSSIAVCLIATTALAMPYVLRTAHAASPMHATSSCAQPPAGKDPDTFTDAQLTMYGLPPHQPKQPKAQWENVARHAKHRVCVSLPTAPVTTKLDDGDCSGCWAGYVSLDQSNPNVQGGGGTNTFAGAYGQWVVPCTNNLEIGSAVGEWVGMGGVFGSLVQVGVNAFTYQMTVWGGVTVAFPRYWAFYENTADPTNPHSIPLFSVNCGDTMEAMTYLLDYGFILDSTTGQYASESNGPAAENAHAECVVEDPTSYDSAGNKTHPDLMDFGALTFNECEAIDYNTSQWQRIDAFDPYETDCPTMYAQAPPPQYQRTLAEVLNGCSLTDIGGFTVRWDAPN